MQLFGYPSDVETDEPVRLSEVSVVASVKGMRELASFLVSCADEMDAQKNLTGRTRTFTCAIS